MKMKLPRIRIGWPQRIAALFLLLFFGQSLYVIGRQPLTEEDYRYALCGREMWEQPEAYHGYFTSCGNMQGDGTLAYRVAGFPLTSAVLVLRVQDAVMRGIDHFKKPEDRTWVSNPITGSTHDLRHQIPGIPYLLKVPFAVFAVWLGGGLWWVSRRLFGNVGGFLALGLYCFSPVVLRFATTPNNEVLAMWGLYGLVYTAIGVAHAMYGPRRKWRPRIALLTFALGMTAAAHLIAAIFGFFVAAICLFYIAQRRRSAVFPILTFAALGALGIVFMCFAFRPSVFLYVFTGGAARIMFSLEPAHRFFTQQAQLPIWIALATSVLIWLTNKRSRYFGNTVPLFTAAVLLPLVTTQVSTAAWFWSFPFLLTFIGGVFADALDTKHRKLFLAFSVTLLLAQIVFCFQALRTIGA